VKTITTSSHRDGDHLVISEMPWPVVAVSRVVGHYRPRWGWDYRPWNAVLVWCHRRERAVVEVPIEHSCAVSAKLWPGSEQSCWHGRDDE
jgi:hypothetical protein